MTESELIELSNMAANMVNTISYVREYIGHEKGYPVFREKWLHEDNARCFELMCRYEIEILVTSTDTGVFIGGECLRNYDDREQATRAVILKAIVAIGERK